MALRGRRIYKYKHQIEFSKVMGELICNVWLAEYLVIVTVIGLTTPPLTILAIQNIMMIPILMRTIL